VKTPVAEGTSVEGTAVTAETIVLAGALERSTAVRTTVAAETPGYAVLVEKAGHFLENWKKPYFFSVDQVLVV
jgi:hypothetical protein